MWVSFNVHNVSVIKRNEEQIVIEKCQYSTINLRKRHHQKGKRKERDRAENFPFKRLSFQEI